MEDRTIPTANPEIYARIAEIYPELHAETMALQHPKKQSRFRKRLKSMQHLHHEGSTLVKGPLAVFAEGILDGWYADVAEVKKWYARLYPRRRQLHGTIMDSSVVGRLVFAEREDAHVGLHHMRIELWARTRVFNQWRLLAEGFTDTEGYFELPFEMMAAHGYDVGDIYFEIHRTGQHQFGPDGRSEPVYQLYHRIPIKKGELTGMAYDLGWIHLPYWEYRPDTTLPRVLINDHDKDAPEQYTTGRMQAIEHQFIPVELTTFRHLEEIKAKDMNKMTIDRIQADYPTNLTVAMEKVAPGITRSDEWFALRHMNGMFASTFDRDPNDPSLYWIYYHWRTYANPDSDYAMPDVSMKFRMQDNGYLLPEEIALTGQLRPGGSPKERAVLTPADGPRWEAAKRAARVSSAITTQVDRHFGETHVNVEQFSIAARRNIHRNPIGAILFPHLKEVTLINHTADSILISPDGYIARSTALSPEGLEKRLKDVLGTLDWRGWEPMEPISDQHTYAHVARLFYDVVRRHVGEFIEGHRLEIADHWLEIFRFSEDLVSHSVPVYLCSYLGQKLQPDAETVVRPTPENAWFNRSNRMDLAVKRCPYRMEEALAEHELEFASTATDLDTETEVRHAVSPVTTVRENPGPEDFAHLAECCAYVIFQATFGHYWANTKQYDDIGEIKYNSLGIRLGTPEHGIFGPEDDPTIAPDLKIATQMMWWSNMLSRTGYGFITTNEESDISPRLIELLEEHRPEFEALGVNIDNIPSRTNI